MLEAALDAAGLDRAVIGLGDADLYRQLLDRVRGRGRGARLDPRPARRRTTWSASRPSSPRSTRSATSRRATCVAPLPAARRQRGPRAGARDSAAPRSSGRRRGCGRPTRRWTERGVADRVQIDLGLLRDLGYYSGAILEVYDPALGHVLGGGGRYDGLLEALRRSTCRRPASPSTWSASTSPRWRRSRDAGDRRRTDGLRASRSPASARQGRRAAEAGGAARRPVRRDASTCSTASASTPPSCAATRAR